jgi:Putative porin
MQSRSRALSLLAVAAAAAVLGLAPLGANAQSERESLESLRQTTLALIEALVQSGVLTRDKADALLADAKRRADVALAQGKPTAEPSKPEPPVVRVPYVPQVVRDQIRNEVREEVLARARVERWGVPNAAAEWTDRFVIEGDIRVRQQSDRPAGDNPSPLDFLAASLGGTTRAPDFAAGSATGLPTGSTQDDRDRLRLRARLAINAKVADTVTAGLRLATGSATDRVSTNQTLGQNFNRYAFLLDRAFIKFDPTPWASVSAGRVANPWFSTDLVWDDDLNFEGLTAGFKWPLQANQTLQPFATLGYFPVREQNGPRRERHLAGLQLGAQWELSPLTRLKFGVAQYVYSGFAGQVDSDYDIVSGAGRSYGQYEYEAGLRQRGNSLFLTNNPNEIAAGLTPDKARWGLGMEFRPLAVTAAAEFSHFAPYIVGLSAEVVRNQAMSLEEAYERSGGIFFNDARAFGVGLRATVGMQQVRNLHDWQFSLGYKWLGSDAVPDAFVDSDLGLGGTNVRGITASLLYGLARDTQVGLRYLSGRTISSPTVNYLNKDRYAADSLQVDLNVRF